MWRVPDCHLACLLVLFVCLFSVQIQLKGCTTLAVSADDQLKTSQTPIQSWRRHSNPILRISDSLESRSPLVLQSHDKESLKFSSKAVSTAPSAEIKRTGSTQTSLVLQHNISISVKSSNVLASRSKSAATAPSPLPAPPVEPPSSTTQPPADSPFTSPTKGCCSENMVPRPGFSSNSCTCVYPIKLELLVENVSSTFANWSGIFQQDLASQLDLDVRQIEITSFHLSGPNLSLAIVIGPLKDISFSVKEAETIRMDLNEYKVHFNSTLFGNYSLVQFVYYEPPLPPSAQSPIAAISTIPQGNSLPEKGSQGDRNDKKLHLWMIIAIPSVSALVIICAILLWLWRRRTKEAKANLKASRSISTPRSCATASIPRSITTRLFTYDELRQATNNFQPENILGEGGFGRVYKGILKDGTAVAIKRLSSGTQGDREFLVEIEMLSRLHHRNLVKLIGYYTSQDSSQHLLCYELIPGGSLEAWLHGPLGASHPLDWNTRIKIALDAARGLAYLHEDSQPCVIHRDFKASNILLENNFHAKVADFGLAKQAPEGQVNYVATQVMGTFGYVAPEYAMTGHLLVKSDVYSYGVVLLELLSGRKPVDMSQPSGQENLVTWARPLLREKERLIELADPRLLGKYPREDFAQVAAIAAACVSPEANQRPTMGEVVQSLKMLQRRSECIVTSDERPGSSDDVLPCLVHNKSFVASVRSGQQPSAGFDSDGSSSVFSSGPFNGVAFDNEVFTRSAVFSEDLHEGR